MPLTGGNPRGEPRNGPRLSPSPPVNRNSGAGPSRNTPTSAAPRSTPHTPPPMYSGPYEGQNNGIVYDTTATLNNARNYYDVMYADERAMLQRQAAEASGRLGAINGNIGKQKGIARDTTALQGRKIDNNIASNAVDLAAIPRMQQLIDDQLGIAGQQKDVDLNQLFLDTSATNRDWWNQVAAQGSSSAPETQLELDDISNTAKNREKSIMFDWTLTQLDAKEQKAKLSDREKQLGLIADNYGIDKELLAKQLEGTLAGLDLQGITTAGQVMDMLSSTNAKERAIGTEIANLAYAEAMRGEQSLFYQPGFAVPTMGQFIDEQRRQNTPNRTNNRPNLNSRGIE